MSNASPLSGEDDEVHGPSLPKRVRLSEAPHIAAVRLEVGADGSLRKALRTLPEGLPRGSDDTPVAAERDGAELADAQSEPLAAAAPSADAPSSELASAQLEANDLALPGAELSPVSAIAEATEPDAVAAEPPSGSDVSPAHVELLPKQGDATLDKPGAPASAATTTEAPADAAAALELLDSSEVAPVAMPGSTEPPTATVAEIDASAIGDGPEAPPAAAFVLVAESAHTDQTVDHPHETPLPSLPMEAGNDPGDNDNAPRDGAFPGFPPMSAQTLLYAEPNEPAPPVRPIAGAYGAVLPLELTPDLTGDHPRRLPTGPPPLGPRSDQAPPATGEQPLATALGAAAKLAADANAAAEALESLKRLLERQLPDPAQAMQQPIHELFAEPTRLTEPPPVPTNEARPEMAQLPEPEDYDPLPASPKPSSRALAKRPAWRERRQFDFRGFMAGFALSWAFGAVLFIYLTAG